MSRFWETRKITYPIENYQLVASNHRWVAWVQTDEMADSPLDAYDHLGVLVQSEDNWKVQAKDPVEDREVKAFLEGLYSDYGYEQVEGHEDRKYSPDVLGDFSDFLSDMYGSYVVYGINVHSHSGEWLFWEKNPKKPDRFDFVYFDTEVSRKYMGMQECDEVTIEKALKSEIKELDAYFRGEVYCSNLATHNDGEVQEYLHSCGGFYDEKSARQDAQEHFDVTVERNS